MNDTSLSNKTCFGRCWQLLKVPVVVFAGSNEVILYESRGPDSSTGRKPRRVAATLLGKKQLIEKHLNNDSARA